MNALAFYADRLAPTVSPPHLDRGLQFLDHVYEELRRGDGPSAQNALESLFLTLRNCKLSSTKEEWDEAITVCREHPLRELIHQDPFTSRAYNKPRGYAGDAVMLDYIYGREENWDRPSMTETGAQVFEYTTQAPASEGVRSRRGYVASLIDRLSDEVRQPELLSIACGHLREVLLCSAMKRRKIGRFVALDADEQSLSEVEREYGVFGVEPVHADMKQLLRGTADLGQFDLVYSMGLFDYLNEPIGRRVVNSMFHMTKPGGRTVVANFLPGVHDLGYMEAYMGWNLIYRNRWDMVNLTNDLPEEEIRDVQLFSEDQHNIIFLSIRRN